MSIKTKLNLILLVLGILASLLIAGLNFFHTRERILKEAYNKAELINAFALASRTYTVKTMRPKVMDLVGKDQFHPEIMGGFFVARAIADEFSRTQPGYEFKQATLDPINPANKADALERNIIKKFIFNPGEKLQKGVLQRGNSKYFYLARPVVARKNCLLCHGDPDSAPWGRKQRYPGPGGYNYKENSVVASFITYISVQNALSQLKSSAIKTVVTGVLSILLIVGVLWFVLGKMVTNPILELAERANDISRGRGLKNKFIAPANNEIGELYNSFERMRKSVVRLMKMARKR